MQLTEVQCLPPHYSQTDIYEIIAVMQSTFVAGPSSLIRWGGVRPSDAQQWLRKAVSEGFASEFEHDRISAMLDVSELPSAPHAEHLVVRDLDLEHLEGSENASASTGRIVAHADYRYAPSFGRPIGSEGEAEDSKNPYPEGFGRDLHVMINDMVESTLSALFRGLPCFELYGISTLGPSHLRKGIAKQLTEWIFPFADRFSLPVILCASPHGLPLYKKCGFEEYREHDVRIELEQFGHEGVHLHVSMVRWPADIKKMPDVWKRWRNEHKAGLATVQLN